jgi:hypothetical protein
MTNPKYDLLNVITGETSQITITNAELTFRENGAAEAAAQAEAVEAKVAARASALAKLAELGLTQEEIAAL